MTLLNSAPVEPTVLPERNSVAACAELTTSTLTLIVVLLPNWALKMFTPAIALAGTPEVKYSIEPLSSWSPAKLAVLEIRVIDSMALSTWSWLASISSRLTAPVLAAPTIRALIEMSKSAASARYPSVVAMTELAR